MKIPDETFRRIKEKLWRTAEERNWPTLSDQQKTALYEDWFRAGDIGGILARYMEPGNVRVYIKDTIMKPYGRECIKDVYPILRLLGIATTAEVEETYIKPHGRRLEDGRVICWGLARDWKTVLFAVFERSYVARLRVPYAAVLMFATGKCQQPGYRRMVETASKKLEIQRLVWRDT